MELQESTITIYPQTCEVNGRMKDEGETGEGETAGDEACSPLTYVHFFIDGIENKVRLAMNEHKRVLTFLIHFSIWLGVVAYVVTACAINFERARILFCLAIIIFTYATYSKVKGMFSVQIERYIVKPIQKKVIERFWRVIKWIMIASFVLFAAVWVIEDSIKDPYRLVSLAGLIFFTIIGFISSKHRKEIKWRPVIWGFGLQFVFAIIILRTAYGYSVFKWTGDRFSLLLGFSRSGSRFIFGDLKQLAFSALPAICYFSALVSVMWYLGMVQFLVKKIGWLLGVTMGTTPPESLNAAGNIFLGVATTPLIILPFLQGMTESELHAVMTSGFASISAGTLAIYVSVGASATHLISASIISAPAGLAMAKLMFPETEESPTKNISEIRMEKPKAQNIFAAISEGARISIGVIASVAVNLIAFLGLLKFANSVLGWLGSMVNVPQLSFEFICSYVFMPFALVMGVPWNDVFVVGEILGINTFVSTFIAYKRLVIYKNNRNETEVPGFTSISRRGEIITTYALCGFSGIVSIGFTLGVLGSFIPERRGTLAKHALRALVSGTLACYTTACIAGLLYKEDY